MTTEDINLTLQERKVLGKGLAKIRREGSVPAVIHNHGNDSIHVQGDSTAMNKVFSNAGKHHPVKLKVGEAQHLALIKDVDFEPTKHQMRHVVFQAINQNEKVTAEIPVVLAGEDIPAEKKSLLVLTQLDHVEVEALPGNLPDQLSVDATTLEEVGDSLSVADIKLPEGVTMLTNLTNQIAIVEMPKDQIAEADAAAASLADDAGVPDEEAEEETPSVGDEPADGEGPEDSNENQSPKED